jgi:hypothetical protein
MSARWSTKWIGVCQQRKENARRRIKKQLPAGVSTYVSKYCSFQCERYFCHTTYCTLLVTYSRMHDATIVVGIHQYNIHTHDVPSVRFHLWSDKTTSSPCLQDGNGTDIFIRDQIRLEKFKSIRIRVWIFNIRYCIHIRMLKSYIYNVDIQSYPIRHSLYYPYSNPNPSRNMKTNVISVISVRIWFIYIPTPVHAGLRYVSVCVGKRRWIRRDSEFGSNSGARPNGKIPDWKKKHNFI